ncbi:MAG: hypothetical protein AAF907_17735 [Planctomycetota bacterium]
MIRPPVPFTSRPAGSRIAVPAVWAGLLAATTAGCNTGIEEYPTAPASGIVTCNGLPLEAGRVVFMPVGSASNPNAGKQARGYILAGGQFILSTYGSEDGAVIGEHRVLVESAAGGAIGGGCSGRVKETVTVTADGPNEFEIALGPLAPGEQVAAGDDDDEEDEDEDQ